MGWWKSSNNLPVHWNMRDNPPKNFLHWAVCGCRMNSSISTNFIVMQNNWNELQSLLDIHTYGTSIVAILHSTKALVIIEVCINSALPLYLNLKRVTTSYPYSRSWLFRSLVIPTGQNPNLEPMEVISIPRAIEKSKRSIHLVAVWQSPHFAEILDDPHGHLSTARFSMWWQETISWASYHQDAKSHKHQCQAQSQPLPFFNIMSVTSHNFRSLMIFLIVCWVQAIMHLYVRAQCRSNGAPFLCLSPSPCLCLIQSSHMPAMP